MATVSFGFSGVGGAPSNSFSGGISATRYTNDTGGYVAVSEIHLLNVVELYQVDYPYQVAIYTDFPGYPYPHQLIGLSEILYSGAMGLGTNIFPIAGAPISVAPGRSVWLAFNQSSLISYLMPQTPDARAYAALGKFDGTLPPYFMASPGLLDGSIPLVAYGDNTPPVGVSSVRVPRVVAEPLTGGAPQVETNYAFAEAASEGYPRVESNLVLIEALHPVMPELPMSTEPFPGFGSSVTEPAFTKLPGLAFSVHKKPTFKTSIKEATSGAEVRTTLAPYPRWEFELTYEFLEDRTGAESSLKTIMGFFLSRLGSFDSFLFKDPDDHEALFGDCGPADGLTTQFELRRTLGGFSERVGQLDTNFPLVVYRHIKESTNIPVAPCQVAVTNASLYGHDLGVIKDGTIPMVKVAAIPGPGQYAVDPATGIYTFNVADQGDAIEISYTYEVDNTTYDVVMPNLIVFDSAPSVGRIYASFQFFFACRFSEDQADFEKFMDKLWSMQECNFRSIIQ